MSEARNERKELNSTELLEDLCGGLARAVDGLYDAKAAASNLGFAATEKEIADTINDVDKAWIQVKAFLSSNK